MLAAEEDHGAPQPLGGVRVFACMSPLTPSLSVCSSHVSLRFAVGEGRKAVSPLLHFAIASLHLLRCQCACVRENLCNYGFLLEGEGGRAIRVLCSESFPEIPSHPLGPGRSWSGKGNDREGAEPSPPCFASNFTAAGEGSPTAQLSSLAFQQCLQPRRKLEGVNEGEGKGNVPSLQLPVEGHECSNLLSSRDSGQHLKMRREELSAVQMLRGEAEQYPLTALPHTFRDANSQLGP